MFTHKHIPSGPPARQFFNGLTIVAWPLVAVISSLYIAPWPTLPRVPLILLWSVPITISPRLSSVYRPFVALPVSLLWHTPSPVSIGQRIA